MRPDVSTRAIERAIDLVFGSLGRATALHGMGSYSSPHEILGLVTVHGAVHQIIDIGMRMLQPRELARAQGFPDDYLLIGSKAAQVAAIGNSVCPVMAEVLVRANVPEMVCMAA